MKFDKKKVLAILAIIAGVCMSIGIALIPNSFFLEKIGTENLYLFMFVIALIGSISTFASIPYPLILISLVSAGGNPLYLALASAAGVIISDASTFFAVRRGRVLLGEKIESSVEYLGTRIAKYPKLVFPGLVTYGTLSPLSNDFVVITFSLMKYAWVNVLVPLAIGNIISNIAVAYLGGNIVSVVSGWF